MSKNRNSTKNTQAAVAEEKNTAEVLTEDQNNGGPAEGTVKAEGPPDSEPAELTENDVTEEKALDIVNAADDTMSEEVAADEQPAYIAATPATAAPRRNEQAPVADAEQDKATTVTAAADLRVVVAGTNAVLVFEKDKPRVLPYRLAMAAQISGGLQNVKVSIDT